jgi:hypothetical protein
MESKKQKWFEASSPILYQKQKPNSIQFSFFHHRLLSPQLVPPPSFGGIVFIDLTSLLLQFDFNSVCSKNP